MTPANDNDEGQQKPAGKVYTLDEAAEHLRLTNRAVAKIAKRNGLCMVTGRKILFTDSDLEQIKDVMRCPSNSQNAVKSGGSAAPSTNSLSMSLRALTKKKSRKPSAPNVKLAS